MAPQKPLGQDFFLPQHLRHNADVVNFMCAAGMLSPPLFQSQRESLTCAVFPTRELVADPSWIYMSVCCRRTSGSLLAGLTTGILGVTGWIGFLYFAVVHLVVRCIHSYLVWLDACILPVGLLRKISSDTELDACILALEILRRSSKLHCRFHSLWQPKQAHNHCCTFKAGSSDC